LAALHRFAQDIRRPPCGALAGDMQQPEIMPFAHVLCPIDFSDRSRQALDRATQLVAPDGQITLLHVIEAPVSYLGAPDMKGFLEDLDAVATRLLTEWGDYARKKLGAAKLVTKLVVGSPGEGTLDVLDKDPTIDLVVLASHGRTGLKRALLGSVAEKLVRHAPCSVHVVRSHR
jgi:nucleotide-binding universal stress UspA family protein